MSGHESTLVNGGTGEVIARTDANGMAFPADLRLAWQPMSTEQAEHATVQANAYLIRSPQLVKALKTGKAYEALGYATWHEYVSDRLVISVQYADLLVKFADRLEAMAEAIDVDAEMLVVSERALRGLPTETVVSVATEAADELGPDATDQERADAAVTAAAKVNADRLEEAAERGRQKAAADLAVARAEKERIAAQEEAARVARAEKRKARQTSDAMSPVSDPPGSGNDGPPAVDPDPGKDPDQEATPGPGLDPDACPSAVGGPGDGTVETQDPPPDVSGAVPPSLPDDWRTDLANACYLLRHPVALLAEAMGADDAHDLGALFNHIGDALDIYESIHADQAIKEQNT